MSLLYQCIKTLTPTSSPTVFQVKDGRLIGIVLSLGKGNESKLFEFFQIVQNCPLLISKSDSIDRVGVDTKLASTTSYVILQSVLILSTLHRLFFPLHFIFM